jgi:hypothetical protein
MESAAEHGLMGARTATVIKKSRGEAKKEGITAD